MPVEVIMPALSPTMEKGKLANWTVKVGDKVEAGDVLAEIETDKAMVELEAAADGEVGKILIEAGTPDVPINTPIAFLLREGEDAAALDEMTTTAPAHPEPHKLQRLKLHLKQLRWSSQHRSCLSQRKRRCRKARK